MKVLNFKKLRASFRAAFHGLRSALSEQTLQILCFCGFVVIIFMFIFGLSFLEKIIIIFLVISVLTFELINSQIEKILDFLQPNHDPKVSSKDNQRYFSRSSACCLFGSSDNWNFNFFTIFKKGVNTIFRNQSILAKRILK